MPFLLRLSERPGPRLTCQVDIGAALDHQLRQLGVAVAHRPAQRRVSADGGWHTLMSVMRMGWRGCDMEYSCESQILSFAVRYRIRSWMRDARCGTTLTRNPKPEHFAAAPPRGVAYPACGTAPGIEGRKSQVKGQDSDVDVTQHPQRMTRRPLRRPDEVAPRAIRG